MRPRSLLLGVAACLLLGACGRTSLFGWSELDGGLPIETRDAGTAGTGGRPGTGGGATGGTAGSTGGTMSTGTGGFAGTGGRATGGTGGTMSTGTGGLGPIDCSVVNCRGTGGNASGGSGVDGGAGPRDAGAGPTGGSSSGGQDAGRGGPVRRDGGAAQDAGLFVCDPVEQNCPANSRCDFPEEGPLVFRCISDRGGRVGPNRVCETTYDCMKGATCLADTDRFGRPAGPALCTVFCNTDDDCPVRNHCLETGIIDPRGELTFGFCLPDR